MPPIAIDLSSVARRAKHQIGIEPEQRIATADLAAFYRFQQEVSAPLFDQLQRAANRGLCVGDDLSPDERIEPAGERFAGGVDVVETLGQRGLPWL